MEEKDVDLLFARSFLTVWRTAVERCGSKVGMREAFRLFEPIHFVALRQAKVAGITRRTLAFCRRELPLDHILAEIDLLTGVPSYLVSCPRLLLLALFLSAAQLRQTDTTLQIRPARTLTKQDEALIGTWTLCATGEAHWTSRLEEPSPTLPPAP